MYTQLVCCWCQKNASDNGKTAGKPKSYKKLHLKPKQRKLCTEYFPTKNLVYSKNGNVWTFYFFIAGLCNGSKLYNTETMWVRDTKRVQFMAISLHVTRCSYMHCFLAIDQHYLEKCCAKLCPKLLSSNEFTAKLPGKVGGKQSDGVHIKMLVTCFH